MAAIGSPGFWLEINSLEGFGSQMRDLLSGSEKRVHAIIGVALNLRFGRNAHRLEQGPGDFDERDPREFWAAAA